MTRKHFTALAEALKRERPNGCVASSVQWIAEVRAIADVCRSFNPGFDRERFYAACGFQEN